MVRTKVMQTAFAYFKDEDKTALSAKKDLLHSFSNTYTLYMILLDLINEVTLLAEKQIESNIERARATHEAYTPNYRFVNNMFAAMIFNNRSLRGYISNEGLTWDVAHESLNILWKQIQASDCYKAYMSNEEPGNFDDDRLVWRKIFTDVLVDNPELDAALEEMEIHFDGSNFATDANVVISYIIKTFKRFSTESTPDQALLEMFDSEDELGFAKELLDYTIKNKEEYDALILPHLREWDLDRIAYMDRIILYVALAEILHFPNIALQVSLNEYIELAKEYSSDKSFQFINGILQKITSQLVKENKLIKAITL